MYTSTLMLIHILMFRNRFGKRSQSIYSQENTWMNDCYILHILYSGSTITYIYWWNLFIKDAKWLLITFIPLYIQRRLIQSIYLIIFLSLIPTAAIRNHNLLWYIYNSHYLNCINEHPCHQIPKTLTNICFKCTLHFAHDICRFYWIVSVFSLHRLHTHIYIQFFLPVVNDNEAYEMISIFLHYVPFHDCTLQQSIPNEKLYFMHENIIIFIIF